MSHQVFCKIVPINLLFDLLDEICLKTDKFYVIDKNSYRKMIFHKYDETFAKQMKDYYYYSKQFYATRKMTYNHFICIVRHICKQADLLYSSHTKYVDSNYDTIYHIYFSSKH